MENQKSSGPTDEAITTFEQAASSMFQVQSRAEDLLKYTNKLVHDFYCPNAGVKDGPSEKEYVARDLSDLTIPETFTTILGRIDDALCDLKSNLDQINAIIR